MKRILALILLLALVCSLCVFAPTAAALSDEEAEALYEKYGPILDALEEGDYSTALDAVWEMKPPIEFEPVEITPENVYDYFEIGLDNPRIERFSDGSIKEIWPGSVYLALKEDFTRRLDWENSNINVTVKGKKALYRAKIDWETGEVTLGDKMDSKVKKDMKKHFDWFQFNIEEQIQEIFSKYYFAGDAFIYKDPKDKYWTMNPAVPGLDAKYYQSVYSDVEITAASGTLYLAPEA